MFLLTGFFYVYVLLGVGYYWYEASGTPTQTPIPPENQMHTAETMKKSGKQVYRGMKRDIRDAKKKWNEVNPETKQKLATGAAGAAGLSIGMAIVYSLEG